jgi:two-component system sensor histidine kinase MtrB
LRVRVSSWRPPRVLRAPAVRLRDLAVGLSGWWRRSLQARVVAATFVMGMLVVWVVGSFLYQQISINIVQDRQQRATEEANRLTREAQDIYLVSSGSGAGDPHVLANAVESLQAIDDIGSQLQGPSGNSGRSVVLLRATIPEATGTPVIWESADLKEADIPDEMREAVGAIPARQYRQIIQLDRPGAKRGETMRILVGTLVFLKSDGWYELYIAFDLSAEQRILDVMRNSLLVGGFALVLLVALVAAVVTRQVVAPVRNAVQAAEELSSGRLDRRMRVRGEDDLARLSRAFNEMAESLEQQIHRLEELSRVQRRFVSDVSHELRTPLTTIRMAGELIYEARYSLDPSLARSAELLTDQLDRFESLLGDLLEISRFDAGAAVLELETEDLCDVVSGVVTGLRPLAEAKDTEIRILPVDEECTAEVDARRVDRVVRNLLANAIEHGEGRPIDIAVATDEHAVAVVVRDRGVGLRPVELQLVFDRFWRADPARARTTGGTGLGLAIALEDAHLHGGRLEVWGALGVGASFRLTLPRRAGGVLRSSPLPLVPDDIPDGTDRSLLLHPTPLPYSLVPGGGPVTAEPSSEAEPPGTAPGPAATRPATGGR